jgi:hypothetical protein
MYLTARARNVTLSSQIRRFTWILLTAISGFGNRLREKGGKPPKGGKLMTLPWQMFGRFWVTGRGDAIY